ncbi:nucleotide synthetase [Caulobacter sp. RL271]|jgi:hypothetical protein|uniref:Uncharacterized protein n=1 Tax=Caulobacter segnis TaxID=88688 RepID=A0ABY4ZXL2_9CAUL|nr:nucleotide synthetase [Caulobacter segnis]USQ97369.1 hypothetical protein MZV50_07465 [Caulobacter segnis]
MISSQFRLAVENNALGKIPNSPDSPKKKFDPKEIIHVIVEAETQNGEIGFMLRFPSPPPPPITDSRTIKNYVKHLATSPTPATIPPLVSPLDIPITQQCWVVVQLGDSVSNWRFSPEEYGCTTKAPSNDRNICLIHAYNDPDDELGDPGAVVRDSGCKLLYFGVRKRGPKNSGMPNPDRDGFNFHIEFIKPAGPVKVIFDPDVKNESENSIPPSGD